MNERTRFWVALSLLDQVSTQRLTRLRGYTEAPELLLSEPPGIRMGLGLPADLKHALNWRAADEEIEKARASDVRILCAADPDFPHALRHIPDGPVLLYLQGKIPLPDQPCAALVGTRRASLTALRAAQRLAADLAAEGVTVISGLARGVDAAAHRGALNSGGITAAVVGNGLENPYPKENRDLIPRISENGAVFSEYSMSTPPFPSQFLRRNRWIAALAQVTVIVEAPLRSGALNTANHARELGRPVLALPGPPYTESSAGSNRLIEEGAVLVSGAETVLQALGETPRLGPAPTREPSPGWPELFRTVFRHVPEMPCQLEEIVIRSGLPVHDVRVAMTGLELEGAVRRYPGAHFGRS